MFIILANIDFFKYTKMSGPTKITPKVILLIVVFLITIIMGIALMYLHFELYSIRQTQTTTQIIKLDPYEPHFHKYMKKFGKNYEGEEFKQRLENFKVSLKEIERLNGISEEYSDYGASYGPTKFSDMTDEEFKAKMMMKPGSLTNKCNEINLSCYPDDSPGYITKIRKQVSNDSIPEKIDRRVSHEVGPVLSQGLCANCWAVSVVGVMESMLLITNQTRTYNPLSIQELTDCSSETDKCNGGSVLLALKFLCQLYYKIVPEVDYKSTWKNEECRLTESPKSGVVVTEMHVECDMSAEDIMRKVANHGPVTAAVDSYPWKNYLGGVIKYHCNGDWNNLAHVVQIVGYDRTAPVPYFILRNSWGDDFGDYGYVYVAMGDFVCGIGRQIGYFDVASK